METASPPVLVNRIAEPMPGGRTSILSLQGIFRLWEVGVSHPKDPKTIATSWGGLKEGWLTLGSGQLVLTQNLSRAGAILIGLLCFFPSLALGAVIVSAIFGSKSLDQGNATGWVLALAALGVVAPPFLIGSKARKFKRQFALADVVKGNVEGVELELVIQPPAASNPSTLAGSASTSATVHLSFKPVDPNGLTALARFLSAAGVEVKDVREVEKADVAFRLTTATPKLWASYLLVALNVIFFLGLSAANGSILSPSSTSLMQWGADFGPLTVNCHQWWRLLTDCFVHIGVLHLLFNMYALLLASLLAERLFGNWFFLLIYLGCGLTGSLTSLWFNPMSVSAGASGAIFGVYGALLGYLAREGGGLPRSLTAPVKQSAWIFIGWNLAYGLLNMFNQAADNILNSLPQAAHVPTGGSFIDMAAHVGGLVPGLIFGFLGARPLDTKVRRALAPARGVVLALGIGAVMALLLIPVLKYNPPDITRLKLLAGMYYRGEGVAKDPAQAIVWLTRAAQQGDVSSQNLLGSIYYQGDGVDKDVAQALQWFSQAGDQGDLTAQKNLAGIYLRGDGVPTNTVEGIKWLTKAAEQGDIESQKLLAASYFKGGAVEQNTTEAIKWASKVAGAGDLRFQKILAQMFYTGQGVEPDKTEAAKWFLLAANQNDSNSQMLLGFMYANGEGVDTNLVEALTWLTVSGDQRPEVSRQCDILKSEMSADQIEAANLAEQKYMRLHSR